MNLFAAMMGKRSVTSKEPVEDIPGRLPIGKANMVQVNGILKSADNSPALRIPVDGKELNIGFRQSGGRFNAVLVDDRGFEVPASTGSMVRDITDPMQGLTLEELEGTLFKMHTSKYGKPAYQNMMKAAQESGKTVSMPPVAAAIARKLK